MTLLVDRDQAGVVTLTLNRPERRNALNVELFDAITATCQDIARNHPTDRVVVITGTAGTFCSGADLDDHSADEVPRPVWMRRVGEACRAVKQLPQPVIAKVSGVAAGGGMCLALCADLVVASEDARFIPVFGDRGLSVDFGGSWLLPRLVGLVAAKELILLPHERSAVEVKAMGLIAAVTPRSDLDAFVDDWVRRLVAGPPLAQAASKRLLDAGATLDLDAALELEAQAQAWNLTSLDGAEALAAFSERREPRYQGR